MFCVYEKKWRTLIAPAEIMQYFIDSNIFLRVFVKENEKFFRDCFDLFKKVEEKKVKAITSVLVLAEIDWVLEGFYQFSKERAIEALESILKLKGLKFVDSFNFSSFLHCYSKSRVKFVDALIASERIFDKEKIVIISYDKDFDKLGLKRLEPAQI